jgi:hypothetical protein
MAKDLSLKHHRGAPAPVNDIPMDQWTPDEVEAHVQFMSDFATRLEGTGHGLITARSRQGILSRGITARRSNLWRSKHAPLWWIDGVGQAVPSHLRLRRT